VTLELLAPSDRGELQLTAARARIPCGERPMMKAIREAVVTVAMLAGWVVAAIAVANLVDHVRPARFCTDATSRASR